MLARTERGLSRTVVTLEADAMYHNVSIGMYENRD